MMAVLDLEALLQPISPEAPCGRNLEYEPAFIALQELARGKPEQVIGDKVRPAQDPTWSAVRDAARTLLASTKDLRVAGILHLALIKTDGVPGFETGISILRHLLERYWDSVHPMLDADDDNDPTFRVNSLIAALVSEQALASLRSAPLVESRQFGRHSLRSHRIASGLLTPSEEHEATDPGQLKSRIEAAFGDATIEALQPIAAAIASASEHLNAMQHILLDKADGIPEDLKPLATDLKDMKAVLDAELVRRGATAPSTDQQGGQPQSEEPHVHGSGAIRTRSDVVAAIERICDYYRRNEPSSPVPLLLQRAKRLVDKDFMDIIRDLTPSGVGEAEVLGGLEKGDR
jgi:type VI secretion system protein ImpA